MPSLVHTRAGVPAAAARRSPPAPPIIPFRWDVTHRECLGRLAEGPPAESYPEFFDDLRCCAAWVLEAACHLAGPAGEPDLLFVGRSPESLFDLLRGLCHGTAWFPRLRPLHFSTGGVPERHLRRLYPAGLRCIRSYFASLGLDPASLLTRPRPAVFIDLVCGGGTFGNLVRMIRRTCFEQGVSWHAARGNVRLVGITWRQTKCPGGERWQRHGPALSKSH